ncbi:thiol peroxidase [Brumimicrobium salinarum]|uniref:Thiol peroxidase n=1 Tax=Brumimicrobium salinarum TaxID=2058658 RepID=A0A2I0R3F9_9FLAO|nr:thiol peroxidase [Brumimicrobium salinarum]PKR81103.1 thiol peroxidase [Brumimicrobium salinarum]
MNLKFKGKEIKTNGNFPKVGDKLPGMQLVKTDLSELNTDELKGKKVVFNIFPSVDTAVCALQLNKFAAQLKDRSDVALVFASLDLPFAFKRFCTDEGIDNAITTSDFRHRDANKLGAVMEGGPLQGLHARGVIVTDEDLIIQYAELVEEVTDEPNYEAALAKV